MNTGHRRRYAAFDTLAGWRVAAVGRPDGSARLAGGLLADVGAQVQEYDQVAAIGAARGFQALLVDDPPTAAWESLGPPRVTEVVCAVDSLPEENPSLRDQTELVTQAAAGHLFANGREGDPPIPCGAGLAAGAGALGAALVVLASAVGRRGDHPVDMVRVSQVNMLRTFLTTLVPHYLLTGQDPPRIGNRHALTAPWNSYPALDGWIVMATMGERQWLRAAELLGRPLLSEDARFADVEGRIKNVEILDQLISERTELVPKGELVSAARAAGVPLSEVATAEEAARHPQREHRHELGRTLGKQHVYFRQLADDSGPHRRPGAREAGALPLAGYRVLEVGLYTAGPLTGRLLALFGADVLKVEPPGGEPGRKLGAKIAGSSYLYFMNNTDKRGCVLDLGTAAGRDEAFRLLRECDVLLTNISEETLTAAGIDYPSVSRACPGIVYCTISGYGATGPFRGRRILDTVMQACTGIMHVTGMPDGPPLKTAASTCDILGAWLAATAVVAALGDSARRRGESQLLDVSLIDAASWLMRPQLESGGRQRLHRRGTSDPTYALHGVFDTGDGRKVAAAVRHPAVLGQLASRVGVATGAIAGWIAAMPLKEVVAAFRGVGAPAHEALTPSEAARHLLVEFPLGGDTHQVFGSPISWPNRGVAVRSAAPDLAQDPPQWLPTTGS